MKRFLLGMLLSATVLGAPPASPGHGHGDGHKPWGKWKLVGNGCRPESTQTVQNGDALSVVFSDFGINMPQGEIGEGEMVQKTCHLTIDLDPPAGMQLDGFEQLYQGGLVKSAGSRGTLVIRYHVGNKKGEPQRIDWKQGMAIAPESPDALFSHTYETRVNGHQCKQLTSYEVELALSGQRRGQGEFFVGGLDTIDAQFRHRVRVTPRWKPCKGPH